MAETLTMKEPPKTELNPDEQESLAIGEEMAQQQDTLLAGKYKNAEELEKAYKELESKLGSQSTDKEPEADKEPEVSKEEVEKAFLDSLWDEAQTSDRFSDDTISKLKDMDPTKLAQEYLDYRAKNTPDTVGLTEENVQNLYKIVGDKKAYDEMTKWAVDNLPKNEIDMFDALIEQGNSSACYFAVKALQSSYNDANGVEGTLLTGKAAKAQSPGFKSQQQLIEAMSDPRYDKDPAYRQDVIEKLARSDVEF